MRIWRPPYGAAIRQVLSRHWPAIWRTGLLVLLLFLAFGPSNWVFVMEAETSEASITFKGETNAWHLEDVGLCTAREKPLREAPPPPESDRPPPCDTRLYEWEGFGAQTISWRPGSTVTVRASGPDEVEVRIGDVPQEKIVARSVLVLSSDAWRRSGALAFTGSLVIGDLIGTGQTTFLRDGRYEVRMKALPYRGDVFETAKSGDLTLGTRIEALNDAGGAPALVHGHLTAPPLADAPDTAFKLAAITAVGHPVLRIDYFGEERAMTVEPDFVDNLLSRPSVIAIVILIGLAANIVEILARR